MNKTIYIIVAAILVLVCLACIVNFSDFSGLQIPEPTRKKLYIGHEYNTTIYNYEDYLRFINDYTSMLPDDFIDADALRNIGEFRRFEFTEAYEESGAKYAYILNTSSDHGVMDICIYHIVQDVELSDELASLDMDIVGENMLTLTDKKEGMINRNGIFYVYHAGGWLDTIRFKVDNIIIYWRSGAILEGTALAGLLSLDENEFQEAVALLTEAFGFVPSETPTPTTP